jgi:hypothetical protein
MVRTSGNDDNLLSLSMDSNTIIYGLVLFIAFIIPLTGFLFTRRRSPAIERGDVQTKLPPVPASSSLLSSQPQKKSKSKNERRAATVAPICPFSSGSNFFVETAEHLPPTPLDLYESWMDVDSPDFGKKPLAARWLNAGLSGHDTPGILRAGLKRLRNSKYFLVEEPFRLREELLMKQKALEDPERFPDVFVAELDSLEAQKEVLDLFLDFLPKRYPDLYVYDAQAQTIHVNMLDQTFAIADYYDHRPLELCERIVQEDLILMRPPRSTDDFDSFAMAAAAVVFSFDGLPEKLGRPIEFLHAPVPGFEEHLRKTLNLTFDRILKVETPLWRNNWGLSPSADLDKPLYGSNEAREHRTVPLSPEKVRDIFLKVEYQTIRRLPTTGYLLFTVKTMADPLYSLEELPNAARCLAASIRGMSPSMRAYKGIPDKVACQLLLDYLDSIVSQEKQT